MKIRLSKTAKSASVIHFLFEENKNLPRDFKAANGEVTVRYENEAVNIYCGLGKEEECGERTLKTAAAKGIQKAAELKKERVSIILPEIQRLSSRELLSCLRGALLGKYKFVKYKSEKPVSVETIDIVSSRPITVQEISRAEIIADSVNYARGLANENAHKMTPVQLAKEALAISKNSGMKLTVLDEHDISRQGLNLLKAVGDSSIFPPRLIILEYNGNSKSKERGMIVGKGITFDSGGLNLKPTGSIETMKYDMAGAAAVLGVMKCIGELKPKINVCGVVPAAHNGIGSKAYFPGDIYKSYEGLTVEICSTDAEGRLILADAISYCRNKIKPSAIVDLATLTGAIVISLGDTAAGLYSNNDELAQKLFDAGERSGERVWRMPLYQEYSDSVKSEIADLRNLSKLKKGYAGSNTAAAFIKEFCGDIPWAHIDIAGTSWNDGAPKGEIAQFATGYGVQLILEYLLNNQ
ncbi:MAG: leucyl aminopeptidase family protein [Chitinispirillales bacterium]|jgi:leucyl aminopeptidase|nr:leucyl aminopeptidase family protein [Chitinispirillales bacterium]